MYNSVFNKIVEQVEALRLDCERQEVYYKTMITTHEVTIGQQVIQIKKLEKGVGELKVDSANRQTAMDIERKQTIYKLTDKGKQFAKAQEVVEDNVQTILRLQKELDSMTAIVDEQVIEIKNLQMDVKTLEEELNDMDKVHSYLMDERSSLLNAVIDLQEEHTLTDDSLILQYTEPEPHPYTHPIRDLPDYSKVKVKNNV